MTSILEKAMVRSESQSRPLRTNVRMDKVPGERPIIERCQASERYRLSVEFFVTFWANRATMAQVREQAERTLLHLLHEDILRHVAALKLAVMSHDQDAALTICDQIETDLGLKSR